MSHATSKKTRKPPVTLGRAFTLTELLVAISIAAMLSAMTLTAMYSARQAANEGRTTSIVTKINELLLLQWAEVETRRLSYIVQVNSQGIPTPSAPRQKLFYQRQLMRLEFPDRKSDLLPPIAPAQRTARYRGYLRSLAAIYGLSGLTEDEIIQQVVVDGSRWTPALQHAECLYLILGSTRVDDGNALDYFAESEIGDVDGDGMKEILDSWGNPIFYLRWAPGYVSELGVPDATQTAQWGNAPDGFDPLKADVMWNEQDSWEHYIRPYQLYPLVVSAGRDQAFDIVFDFDMVVDAGGTRGAPVVYRNERGDPSNGFTGNNPYVMRCRANLSRSVPDNDCGMSTSDPVGVNLSKVMMIGTPWDTDSSSFPGDPASPPVDNFEDNISNQQTLVN